MGSGRLSARTETRNRDVEACQRVTSEGHRARTLSRAARDNAHVRSTLACSSTRSCSLSLKLADQGPRLDGNAQEQVSDGVLYEGRRDVGRGTRGLVGHRPQAQAVDQDAERALCGPVPESGFTGLDFVHLHLLRDPHFSSSCALCIHFVRHFMFNILIHCALCVR
ncbi:hypothetical protein VNO78_19883 [Psophocarpus tetragonolobus]|uniref:Uncharacterized protein n=1 Tax=Psophocarpus tetragonolobus TaxID=3891 RepID=A0AAN9SD93_PSOTE